MEPGDGQGSVGNFGIASVAVSGDLSKCHRTWTATTDLEPWPTQSLIEKTLNEIEEDRDDRPSMNWYVQRTQLSRKTSQLMPNASLSTTGGS